MPDFIFLLYLIPESNFHVLPIIPVSVMPFSKILLMLGSVIAGSLVPLSFFPSYYWFPSTPFRYTRITFPGKSLIKPWLSNWVLKKYCSNHGCTIVASRLLKSRRDTFTHPTHLQISQHQKWVTLRVCKQYLSLFINIYRKYLQIYIFL